MYKEILEALKTKFEGVSDAVLGRIAKKLANTVTTAEQVKTAVEGVTIQQVIDGYADSRATDATQTAIQNYEKKYGLKDGAKVDVQSGGEGEDTNAQKHHDTSGAGGAENVPAWAQALIDSNKKLTERLNQVETERTTATRKQQLQAIVAKLPEKLRKPYERTSVDNLTDEQFSELVTEITAEVDGIAGSINQKGAVFGRPTAKSGNQSEQELTKEQQDAITKRDTTPAAEGQPF